MRRLGLEVCTSPLARQYEGNRIQLRVQVAITTGSAWAANLQTAVRQQKVEMPGSKLRSAARISICLFVLWICLVSACPPGYSKPTDLPDLDKIPEPMVFDLVRPLGAKKGEWEVNTLFTLPITGRNRRFGWEPESEYALARGWAVEPQVLFSNGRFEGFQGTVQKTFGTFWHNKPIHGALLRGEYLHPEKQLSSDAAYLIGARLTHRWSVFGIPGLRRRGYWGGGRFFALLNPSIFYHINDNLEVGLENNLELGGRRANRYLFTPQVHWTFTARTELQVAQV